MGIELIQSDLQLRTDGFYYKMKRCYGVCQVRPKVDNVGNTVEPHLLQNFLGENVH